MNVLVNVNVPGTKKVTFSGTVTSMFTWEAPLGSSWDVFASRSQDNRFPPAPSV